MFETGGCRREDQKRKRGVQDKAGEDGIGKEENG